MELLSEEQPPLVTTIILTYRRFEYLYYSLGSLLSQDYPRLEIIIADDGSPNLSLIHI